MSFWSGTSVLVTGGAGFVGTHLVRALLQAGAERVAVLDDFSTGREEGVAALATEAGDRLSVHRGDVATPPDLPKAGVIFNLACPASPLHYQADPLRTWRTSVLGTHAMLGLAQGWGARFVQASTSEVYGDPVSHPQRETDWGHVNPIGPRACYDEGKRAAETLLMDAARHAGADIRIARIFNTYGPGMADGDGRAVPAFLSQALAGEALSLHGDGSQTRSFCHVSDLVTGLMLLAETEAARGEVVNLGNPEEITMSTLAERILALTGATSGLRHDPRPVDDPTRRRPDIAKARRLLGWAPRVTLDDGLRGMLSLPRP